MNTSHLIGALAASFLLVSGAPAATITYQYEGSNFDTFPFTSAPGEYTTSMSVTGSFTVDDSFALPTTLLDIESDVISYSFFDGRNTLTESNSTVSGGFRVRADGGGQIFEWDIPLVSTPAQAAVGDEEYVIVTKFFPGGLGNQRDSGRFEVCTEFGTSCTNSDTDLAQITSDPGTWSSSAVPIPSAVWLFGSGLLGLMGMAKRNKA